jgi:hypothetical protein
LILGQWHRFWRLERVRPEGAHSLKPFRISIAVFKAQ